MLGQSRIDGIRRRVRAWLFFIFCGLAIIWFGDYLENQTAGMGESIISVGIIWSVASFLFLIINLVALQIEKRKSDEGHK
jgi:hypothetical protein